MWLCGVVSEESVSFLSLLCAFYSSYLPTAHRSAIESWSTASLSGLCLVWFSQGCGPVQRLFPGCLDFFLWQSVEVWRNALLNLALLLHIRKGNTVGDPLIVLHEAYTWSPCRFQNNCKKYRHIFLIHFLIHRPTQKTVFFREQELV